MVTAGLSACVPDSQPDNQFLTELERLTAKEDIRNLLLDYGRHLDSRDFEAYSQLFAADGEWIGGFGTVSGPAAIQIFMEDAIPGPNTGNTYHLLSNFQIDVRGDEATASSRWAFVTGGSSDTPTIVQGGRYEDTLVRENGAWKFSRREALLDIPVSFPPED